MINKSIDFLLVLHTGSHEGLLMVLRECLKITVLRLLGHQRVVIKLIAVTATTAVVVDVVAIV